MSLSETERHAGLDQPLPPGEHVLWQGKPSRRAMGAVVFRFRLVWLYLVALMAMATLLLRDGGWPLPQAIALAILAIPLGLAGLGILSLIGMLMAKTTTYTLTNRRIVMHIGIAYDRTISIPLSAVTDASIRPRGKGGLGDIAFAVKDTGGLNYINLWPHARSFHFLPPQPSLRALPDAGEVAERIGDALIAFNTAPRVRLVKSDSEQPAEALPELARVSA